MKTLQLLGILLPLAAAVATAQPRAPKQALAFYYTWYGNPETSQRWVRWDNVNETSKTIGNSPHFPTIGAYDSHSLKVVDQHFRWARFAGLTGLIVSWWAQSDFQDQGMAILLQAASKHGLKLSAYIETLNPPKPATPENALKDVMYLLENYGKNPVWLKVSGRPVVFIYGRAVNQLGLEGWRQVIRQANERFPGGAVFIGDQITAKGAEVFDGIHAYNPTGRTAGKSLDDLRAWARDTYPQWVKAAGPRIACVTVIPGYDDSKLTDRPAPRPITNRYNGDAYRVLWEEAVAAKPDWVLITTFNQWQEGSEIEPSDEYGPRELRTTQEFTKKFLR